MCDLRRFRAACTRAQAGQSFCCPFEEALDPCLPTECLAKTDQTAQTRRQMCIFAGLACSFVRNAVPRLMALIYTLGTATPTQSQTVMTTTLTEIITSKTTMKLVTESQQSTIHMSSTVKELKEGVTTIETSNRTVSETGSTTEQMNATEFATLTKSEGTSKAFTTEFESVESTHLTVRNVIESTKEFTAIEATTPPAEKAYSTPLSLTSKKEYTAISSGKPTNVSHIAATSEKSIGVSSSTSLTSSSTTPTNDTNDAREDFTSMVLLACGYIISYSLCLQ